MTLVCARGLKHCFGAVALLLLVWANCAASDAVPALVAASRDLDLPAVRTLIRRGDDVNRSGPDGTSALHWAAYHDDVTLAEQLVRAGADSGRANAYGIDPLSLAVENGSVEMVRLMLRGGAKALRAGPLGQTALMTAARVGNERVVDMLLSAGAPVNAREETLGQTALMWAVAEGHASVLRILLTAGADLNLASHSGFSPLMFAARLGSASLVTDLIRGGARVNAAADDGTTALLVATMRGHLDAARTLLAAGADPNLAEPGYTVLHWAVGRWETEFTKEYAAASGDWRTLRGLPDDLKAQFVDALLAHGADVNAIMRKAPPRFGNSLSRHSLDGSTPFLIAAMSGDAVTMRRLLKAGAQSLVKTAGGATAVSLAAGLDRNNGSTRITEAESIAAVNVALEAGVDLNAADTRGETALHACAYNGTNDLAKALLEGGARFDVANANGQTPLGVAEGHYLSFMILSHSSTAALLRSRGARDIGAPPRVPLAR